MLDVMMFLVSSVSVRLFDVFIYIYIISNITHRLKCSEFGEIVSLTLEIVDRGRFWLSLLFPTILGSRIILIADVEFKQQ